MSDKPELKVVEAFPDSNPKVCSLHDRLMDCIHDYVDQNKSPVTRAEVIGTLEFVKVDCMSLKFDDEV